MTRKLCAQNHPQPLLERLQVADSLWTRTKGLLGRQNLPENEGLWILRCNSIHTFFMKFAIDLVFVDRNLKVLKTYRGVKPGRVIFPVWHATSVIELKSGFLNKHPLRQGEQLHVDPTLS